MESPAMGLGCHALDRFSDHDPLSMADAPVEEQPQILPPELALRLLGSAAAGGKWPEGADQSRILSFPMNEGSKAAHTNVTAKAPPA